MSGFEGVKMRDLLVLAMCIGLMGCGDGPPKWPAETRMTATTITGNSVTLEWPAPQDADGIKAYAVRQNGTLLAQIEGNVTSYTAENLEGMTEYKFEVVALDNKGKWSEPLSLPVKTGDSEVPKWPEGSTMKTALESKGPLGTAVTFTWSEASDNVAVTGYRIIAEGETVGEVGVEGRELVYQSVDVDGSYQVQAGDAAGNWSNDGPSARVWANKGLRPMLRSQGLLNQPAQGFDAPQLMQAPRLQVTP